MNPNISYEFKSEFHKNKENKLKDEQIILLSHYLCHIYERSTTAVSYPAPTYYADHAAERGRKYLQDKIPKNK